MTPERSIHPAVGSIFSPTKEERMPAPLLEYDAIGTVGNQAETHALIPPATPPRAVRAPVSPSSEAMPHREDAGPPAEAFQPIAPIPRRTAPAVRTPRTTGSPLEEPATLGSTETGQQPGIHVEAEEVYTPLLPPAAQSADAEGEILRPSQTAVSTASKEALGLPRRAAPSKSEPDEIQIHIGRIEVTAVPQTAPRPAVVSPSKSINLDEYLKRGRGRA